MKTSKDRILTTHTGSLPRPKPLIDLVMNRERGEMIDAVAFEAETAKAIDDIVVQQLAAGIDVVSDGEMSKPSYTTYIRHRVSGIAPDPRAAEKGRDIMVGRDLLAHPDFARRRNSATRRFPAASARRATRTAASSTGISPTSNPRRANRTPPTCS
jgi:5-methyltetrahydropteroyltriglutamate--homocysteine methyltransferase